MYGRHIAAAASRLLPEHTASALLHLQQGEHGQPDRNALRLLVRAVLSQRVQHGVLRSALIEVYRAGWAAGEAAAHDAIQRLTPASVRDSRIEDRVSKADRSTGAELSSGGPAVDWSTWTPGNLPAARQADSLDALISDAVGADEGWSMRAAMRGNLLASIEDTRLGVLSNALADALEQGASVAQLDKVLQSVLTDTSWSEMVATTEMARAMTAASLASYEAAGIPAKEALTASDMAVCVLCAENEDMGPIPLDSDFPNGPPPTHPSCRCAVLPAWIDLPNSPADLLAGYSPEDA